MRTIALSTCVVSLTEPQATSWTICQYREEMRFTSTQSTNLRANLYAFLTSLYLTLVAATALELNWNMFPTILVNSMWTVLVTLPLTRLIFPVRAMYKCSMVLKAANSTPSHFAVTDWQTWKSIIPTRHSLLHIGQPHKKATLLLI